MRKNWIIDLDSCEFCRYDDCYVSHTESVSDMIANKHLFAIKVSDNDITFFIKKSEFQNLLIMNQYQYFIIGTRSVTININENQVSIIPNKYLIESYESKDWKSVLKVVTKIKRDKKLKDLGLD